MKRNLRAARQAFLTLRSKGYSTPAALLVHLPVAACLRAYRVIAQRLNSGLPFSAVNARRLGRSSKRAEASPKPRFYVIVVPGTLHFLIPCLSLVSASIRCSIVLNGARPWETAAIRRRFPQLEFCTLLTLPFSSLTHGDAITLLLNADDSSFGILDHDLYVFDPHLFEDLDPGPRRILTAIFGEVGAHGLPYPHTSFLFFDTLTLRSVMHRYGVTARLYRKAPRQTATALQSIGLTRNGYLKAHHNFFDTLTLLYALAFSEGLGLRFRENVPPESVAHLGSTSAGTPKTKPLLECYIQLRFVELLGDPELMRRYHHRFGPFEASRDLKARIPLTPANYAIINKVDDLAARLESRLKSA
ncbi:MAG: hypothetical protein M3Z31_08695 [Pseudomonadota bacterium]|nr:hypothetical protein [Pseudomonadota bacterium]